MVNLIIRKVKMAMRKIQIGHPLKILVLQVFLQNQMVNLNISKVKLAIPRVKMTIPQIQIGHLLKIKAVCLLPRHLLWGTWSI